MLTFLINNNVLVGSKINDDIINSENLLHEFKLIKDYKTTNKLSEIGKKLLLKL